MESRSSRMLADSHCCVVASAAMPTLKSTIASLAENFSAGVLAAIRSASLEEILGGSAGPAKRGPGRPPKRSNGAAVARGGGGSQPDPLSKPTRAKRGKGGRLARRSPEEIAQVVESIVGALKKSADGMRSEQLQKLLKLDKKEIRARSPRLSTGRRSRRRASAGRRRTSRAERGAARAAPSTARSSRGGAPH